MKDINVYTNEEKSVYQPTLFEFFTDEELGITESEGQEVSTLASDLIN